MPDEKLLAALGDPESFRRYIDERLVKAVGEVVQRVNDEEDTRTIWGIPVVEDDTMPSDEIRLVVGRGVIRQDGTLEWDEDAQVWRVTNIGEPYHA